MIFQQNCSPLKSLQLSGVVTDLIVPFLQWHTVRMKNSQVRDWEGLVNCLKRHETQHLDLRKMLLVPNEDSKAMWDKFLRYIVNATSLQRLDLCRCPARVIEKVAEKCPQLKVINALAIK